MKGRSEITGQIDKLVYLQNQLTGQTKMVRLTLLLGQPQNLINLTLSFKISNLQQQLAFSSQLFFMNPYTRICQYLGVYPFQDDIFIQIDPTKKDRLHFKFRKIQIQPISQATVGHPEPQLQCSRKSRERTIGQVRGHINNWKNIYNKPKESGEFYTLQQAADKIGLPKKTLDDYERHIRMAEAMDFDFQKNKNAGMGLIRNFVKEQNSNMKNSIIVKEEIVEPDIFLNIGNHRSN